MALLKNPKNGKKLKISKILPHRVIDIPNISTCVPIFCLIRSLRSRENAMQINIGIYKWRCLSVSLSQKLCRLSETQVSRFSQTVSGHVWMWYFHIFMDIVSRAFILYQNIHEKSIILENSLTLPYLVGRGSGAPPLDACM